MAKNIAEDIIFYSRKQLTVPDIVSEDLSPEERDRRFTHAMTAIRNIEDLGFTVDKEGTDALCAAPVEKINEWYFDVSERLTKAAGGDHKYNPMYKNFPEEVMAKTDAELVYDQIMYYILTNMLGVEDAKNDPAYKELFTESSSVNRKEMIKSLEEHPLKVLKTIPESAKADLAVEIFKNTVNSKMTPSPADMENIVNPVITEMPGWEAVCGGITNRELLSYLAMRTDDKNMHLMTPLVTNDYLRLMSYASYAKAEGTKNITDLKAAGEMKPASLSRADRVKTVSGLDSLKNLEEDVARDRQKWKDAFRLLHVGEYKQYKNVSNVAYKLRNNKRLETFYGRVDKAFKEKDFIKALDLYRARPGEFIKNINRFIIAPMELEKIAPFLKKFEEVTADVCKKARVEDLVSLISYVNSRMRPDRLPIHKVNGKLITDDKNYPPVSERIAGIIKDAAAYGIYAQRSEAGMKDLKVYTDPAMYKMAMPSDIYDTSDTLRGYTKGSRIPIEKTVKEDRPAKTVTINDFDSVKKLVNEDPVPEAKNIRLFVWWTNTKDCRVDIDLSAVMFKEDKAHNTYEKAGELAYYSFEKHVFGCVHSGDITNGGKFGGDGVCEYVDLDLDTLKENGIDYVKVFVNSYCGINFPGIPNSVGWMEREETDKSAQFDIRAVKQCCKLEGNYAGIVPCIVDVKNEEVIWTDSPERNARAGTNAGSRNIASMDVLMDMYGKGDRMSMGDMVKAVYADAVFVDAPEKADIAFLPSPVSEIVKEPEAGFLSEASDAPAEKVSVVTAMEKDVWVGMMSSDKHSGADKKPAMTLSEFKAKTSKEKAVKKAEGIEEL